MTERAGNAQDFSRLELYLDKRLGRRAQQPAAEVAARAGFECLRRALARVQNVAAPTHEEAVYIWTQAFDELGALAEAGTECKVAERTVFAVLKESGVNLAKNDEALRKAFGRNLARWQAGGGKPSALRDGRRVERTDLRLPLPDADRETIIARAVEHGGRISQGWRVACKGGELSPEVAARYIGNPANKSYMPRSVRDRVRHDVALLEDIHHGPRQAKLNGPFIPRNYDDIGPADWMQGDDVTLPAYFWEDTSEGVRAMRGQFLLMVDVRTSLILGFALHSERNYNAAIIRSLIVRVHDQYGLPREGFYFEKGLWERSRLLKGRAADEITLEETEQGLREFVRFKHATLPRGKVVERIIGLLQNEIDPLPGYVGRNEQTEKFERIQKQLRQAGAGKIAYSSFLLSKEQWLDMLERICARFNDDPQHGRNQGLSPREAYESGFNYQSPLTRLPDSSRYLLANHRRKEKVTRNGLRIVMGGEPNYYRNADTGRLIGQEVLVWLDPENLDSVTVTDLQRRHPVTVPRVDELPSMTATADQLGAAHAQAAAHLAHARTLYRIIEPRFKRAMFRAVLADATTVETGAQIAAGREKARVVKDQAQQPRREVAAAERKAGVRFAKPHRNPAERRDGVNILRRADELERQEGGQS